MEQELKDRIMEALENVVDPEIGVDIVNLGLIYDMKLDDDGIVWIDMTLTSMGCPMAGMIVTQVQEAVKDVPEVNAANVNLVWSPPWNKDMMSRYAKIALGMK
ncbi:metal-sulfur cluster assembly factor [Bacillus benzoevorans]|uniref:Metal-sulfur cluster biosynthetic enzyme n=1 Tax=Bacillus benzoevorans TaxID=1456 RepID=A0A7X0HRE3_9BACI|nr:metal-sulfur cluster assembly factor [Bacillus benzoevorans]MBB6444377.1 metal-sulfur cluster biosynthetic enzyme [Bacillus benzoevorans]